MYIDKRHDHASKEGLESDTVKVGKEKKLFSEGEREKQRSHKHFECLYLFLVKGRSYSVSKE